MEMSSPMFNPPSPALQEWLDAQRRLIRDTKTRTGHPPEVLSLPERLMDDVRAYMGQFPVADGSPQFMPVTAFGVRVRVEPAAAS